MPLDFYSSHHSLTKCTPQNITLQIRFHNQWVVEKWQHSYLLKDVEQTKLELNVYLP